MKYALSVLVLVMAAGCTGVPAPLARNFYNLVTPRYKKSVMQDNRLNEGQKKALLQGVESFNRLLKKAEE